MITDTERDEQEHTGAADAIRVAAFAAELEKRTRGTLAIDVLNAMSLGRVVAAYAKGLISLDVSGYVSKDAIADERRRILAGIQELANKPVAWVTTPEEHGVRFQTCQDVANIVGEPNDA